MWRCHLGLSNPYQPLAVPPGPKNPHHVLMDALWGLCRGNVCHLTDYPKTCRQRLSGHPMYYSAADCTRLQTALRWVNHCSRSRGTLGGHTQLLMTCSIVQLVVGQRLEDGAFCCQWLVSNSTYQNNIQIINDNVLYLAHKWKSHINHNILVKRHITERV